MALALEYLNANEHGVSVIPVKDMATIPHFAENYFLSEGRLLTLEDDAARNKVCVVHQGLADRRNLKVGDTLTITIKDLEMYHWGQTYPDWEPNLAGAPEVTESYTIVGTVYSLQKIQILCSIRNLYSELFLSSSLPADRMGWKLWFCAPESRRQSRFFGRIWDTAAGAGLPGRICG